MDKIMEKVRELNEILVDSDVYQNYFYAKEKLSGEAKQLVVEYKSLRNKYLREGMDFEKEKILSSVYSKLMLNEASRVFIQNELELTKLIKQIYIKLAENIEVEIFD